jgi:hypothetical protein
MARRVTRYDPLDAPDPLAWLATDEHERQRLIEDYHRRQGTTLPDAKAHALIHLAIEGQIAADAPDVRAALQRLIAEGLDRHEAVHALSFVFVEFMHDAASGKSEAECKATYATKLQKLTAEGWRRAFLEEDGDLDDPPGLTGSDSAPENGERMAPDDILAELAADRPFPFAAVEAARADRATMVPLFIAQIEKCIAGTASEIEQRGIFLIFHLLGEWREKASYRPLASLLRLPSEKCDTLLNYAVTETGHRVMAAVFDGDPQPLYDVILDPAADEFARSKMCEVLAMAALRGELPCQEAARFLNSSHGQLKAEPHSEHGNQVWYGWQSAIAALGLRELEPLVKQEFESGRIEEMWLRYHDFAKDLAAGIANQRDPKASFPDEMFGTLFGDTVEELSGDYAHGPDEELDSVFRDVASSLPAVNPYKGVGRNDPCPCGSGKKFKRCCLDSGAAERFVA